MPVKRLAVAAGKCYSGEMRGKIVAEIFGGRIKPLLTWGLQSSGRLRLTTSDDYQAEGRVRLLLQRPEETFLLEEILVERIPRAEAGQPDVDLEVTVKGRAVLQARILVNGRTHRSIDIDLKGVGPGRGRGAVLLAVALVVAAVAAILCAGGQVAESGMAVAGENRPAAENLITDQPVQPARSVAVGNGRVRSPAAAIGTSPNASAAQLPAAVVGTRTLATVYFFPENHLLYRDAQIKLNGILPALGENPGWKVTLAGHCALYDDEASREWLSSMRVDSVYTYLKRRGWRPATEPVRIGYGGKLPATRDRQNQHLNRRVEILY